MQLNHINLGVTDVPATVAMFKTCFGLRPVADFPANDKMAFLQTTPTPCSRCFG